MAIRNINTLNPDSSSIVSKKQIDISLSLADISASGHSGSIKTNYQINSQIIITDPEVTSGPGKVYYTPIYKEKINRSAWLSTINKNFEELQ